MKHSLRLLLSCLLCLLPASSLHAADPAVEIEADQVEMREQDNISIYRGNVKITRGSTKISGDEITIRSEAGKLDRIRISGQPATYRQVNTSGEEITAESMQMEYMADSGILELREQAVLIKNNNRFSSPRIVYDTQNDIVRAGHTQTDNTEQPRVQITIQPDKTITKP